MILLGFINYKNASNIYYENCITCFMCVGVWVCGCVREFSREAKCWPAIYTWIRKNNKR